MGYFRKMAKNPEKMNLIFKTFILCLFLFTKPFLGHGVDEKLQKLDQNVEKGYQFLNEGNFEEAKKIFIQESRSPLLLLHLFSELGLAKIAIEEKKYKTAKTHLDPLKEEDLRLFSELWHEWLITQGDLHYRLGNEDLALEYLEKATPKKNHQLASFGPKSLILLTRAWQKKAEACQDPQARQKALQAAEKAYHELAHFYPASADPLEVARLLSLKARLLNQPEFYLEASHAFKEDFSLKAASCLIQEGSLNSLNQAQELLENENSPMKDLLLAECWIKQGELEKAREILAKETPLQEKRLFLLGTLTYQQSHFDEAVKYFEEILNTYPASELIQETLYWTARSDPKNALIHYTRLYQEFKDHPLAAEAYFYCYSPSDYLLGNRAAMKHLHAFKSSFPDSPLVLNALYLEGLDYLHDRRSLEGKWLTRKNLIQAIHSFTEVEVQYERLDHLKLLSQDSLELKNQAALERAKTNYLIADQSTGTKHSIYLDYAENAFQEMIAHFKPDSNLAPLQQEALYYYALILFKKGNREGAKKAFDELIQNYDEDNSNYYLSKSFYQLGLIAKDFKSYHESLIFLEQALKAGQTLSINEILEILIEKSEIFRISGDLDAAMMQLSEVVDYHAVSSMRLKAMYLRAEIYALQGRYSLAKKQLESLSLKGGSNDSWAIKAKEKLKQEYGFD